MVGIWFAFKIFLIAICAGAVISVLIFVPLAIYIIPYALWVGHQNTKGLLLERKKDGFWKIVKHASITYRSWIRREKPSF